MDPETVREVLQVINEVSQPVYAAAYRKVIITNLAACIALFPLLVVGIWFSVHAAKKGDSGAPNYDSDWTTDFIVGIFATICACAGIIIATASLLTADYRTYQAIRALLW